MVVFFTKALAAATLIKSPADKSFHRPSNEEAGVHFTQTAVNKIASLPVFVAYVKNSIEEGEEIKKEKVGMGRPGQKYITNCFHEVIFHMMVVQTVRTAHHDLAVWSQIYH